MVSGLLSPDCQQLSTLRQDLASHHSLGPRIQPDQNSDPRDTAPELFGARLCFALNDWVTKLFHISAQADDEHRLGEAQPCSSGHLEWTQTQNSGWHGAWLEAMGNEQGMKQRRTCLLVSNTYHGLQCLWSFIVRMRNVQSSRSFHLVVTARLPLTKTSSGETSSASKN